MERGCRLQSDDPWICDGIGGGASVRLIRYPDGQASAVVDGCLSGCDVTICSRMSGFGAVQDIACVASAVRSAKAKSVSLRVPYFLGARSDRSFGEGTTNYLKDVICPIINGLNFKKVEILDPHSDVLPALLKRVEVIPLDGFYRWCGEVLDFRGVQPVVVCPDAGAQKRAMKFAQVCGLEDVVCCSKDRDVQTGEITRISIPVEDFDRRPVVIVDDICDGGATFMAVAMEINNRNSGPKTLVVTHGIFSKGFGDLRLIFDRVLCTDSLNPVWMDSIVTRYEIYGE